VALVRGQSTGAGSVARFEDAAKQLIALTNDLHGIYFAVFAFRDLRKQLGAMRPSVSGSAILLCFGLPIVLWLLSLDQRIGIMTAVTLFCPFHSRSKFRETYLLTPKKLPT
jgi:hypothetical protein